MWNPMFDFLLRKSKENVKLIYFFYRIFTIHNEKNL